MAEVHACVQMQKESIDVCHERWTELNLFVGWRIDDRVDFFHQRALER